MQAPASPDAATPSHWLVAAFVIAAGSAFLLPGFAQWAQVGSAYVALHVVLTGLMLALWGLKTVNQNHVLWAAILLRLALIPVDLITSNDAERYLWDGAVALSGLDPYTTSPDDPAAASLRAVWPTPPEHSAYPTIYPPAALMLFSTAAIAGPAGGIVLWKVMSAIASIAALFLFRDTLARRGLMRALPLFALSPLLLLETGLGGHLDIFLVLGICAAIWLTDRQRFALAGAAIGASAAIKFLPLVLLAPLIWQRPLKPAIALLAGAGLALVFFYGCAFFLGMKPLGVLLIFFEKWRFASPLFTAVETLAAGPYVPAILVMIAGLFMLLAARALWRGDRLAAATLLLATPLLISPVVFPWYLSVLVPFSALRPSATLIAWLSTAPLSYVVLNRWISPERVFEEARWPIFAIALAWAIGLAIDGARNRHRASREETHPTADAAGTIAG